MFRPAIWFCRPLCIFSPAPLCQHVLYMYYTEPVHHVADIYNYTVCKQIKWCIKADVFHLKTSRLILTTSCPNPEHNIWWLLSTERQPRGYFYFLAAIKTQGLQWISKWTSNVFTTIHVCPLTFDTALHPASTSKAENWSQWCNDRSCSSFNDH